MQYDQDFFIKKGEKGGKKFKEWLESLTPEQREQFYAPAREGSRRYHARKRAEKAEKEATVDTTCGGGVQ